MTPCINLQNTLDSEMHEHLFHRSARGGVDEEEGGGS